MACTLVVTSMSHAEADGVEQNTIVLDWISHTDGTVSADIASTFAAAQKAIHKNNPQPTKIKGPLVGIETIPGLNGDLTTALPSNLYDITLDDPYNLSLAATALANRSGTVAEKVVPSQPIPVDSEITLEITNAGDTKKGRIILYLKPGG